MDMGIAFVRGQAETIEQGAEAWKGDSANAEAVFELEELIAVTLGLNRAIEQLQRLLWQRLRTNPRFPAEDVGERIEYVYTVALRVFALLERCAAWAYGEGYKVAGLADFQLAHAYLQEIHEDFRERWPRLTLAEIEAGRAEIARGDFVTLEEAIRELDTPDSP